jgi:hypothetical protein
MRTTTIFVLAAASACVTTGTYDKKVTELTKLREDDAAAAKAREKAQADAADKARAELQASLDKSNAERAELQKPLDDSAVTSPSS